MSTEERNKVNLGIFILIAIYIFFGIKEYLFLYDFGPKGLDIWKVLILSYYVIGVLALDKLRRLVNTSKSL